MANTIVTSNRTIELSVMDEDYTMDNGINVESVVLIPGAAGDEVEIFEYVSETELPSKTKLVSTGGEPRVMYFYQRLRLGFDYGDSKLSQGSKIIFNIGVRNY